MPKRICVLVTLALFLLAACGDDAESTPTAGSGAPDAGASAGAGSGTSGAGAGGKPSSMAGVGAGSGGAGGLGSPGGFDEGSPCMTPSDCETGLRCNASPILLNGVPVGVCGKPCAMDAECGEDAICYAYSMMDRDKHCVDVIKEDYGACGVAETAVCSMSQVCLLFPDTPVIGVCVTLCDASASDDDAGVAPGGMGCAAGQSCIPDVLSDGKPNEGVCGKQVARGATCGIDIGLGDFCGPDDVCAPDDAANPESEVHCYEGCTSAAPQCDKGACLLLSNTFGYCK